MFIAINSDHNTEFVKVNFYVISKREEKREIFNLKNELCQFTFKRSTENAQELLSCLNSRENISVKCEKWKTYFRCTHKKKAFRKIKVKKNRVKPSAADALIDKRNSLKILNNKSQEKEALDAQIAVILLKEEVDKAKHFVKFCNATGTFPLLKMWKLKKELWPKKAPSLPVAKLNNKGRLITSPKELMHTLAKEYKDRLRTRKCKKELKEHMEKMHEVTKLKLSKAWMNKSPSFNMDELNQGIKDMNKGRARDPRGLCAEQSN